MIRIKNIVFDLGGVIMNLNVLETIEKFNRLGIEDIVNATGHHYTDPIFYDFEIGKVSPIEFIEKLKSMSALTPSDNDIKDAWNAMILDMPKEKIRFLMQLKREYNIFLLSNTNSIHQEKFIYEVNRKNNIFFNDLFVKAYYSHEIGLRKPSNEVFYFLLRENNLKADETLFVDDSMENIKSAEAIGIKGSLYSGGSLEKHITDYIIN